MSGLRFLRRSVTLRLAETGRRAAEWIAVVQSEIRGYSREQRKVRLAQRVTTSVSGLQGMVGTEQSACHAGQVDRCADSFQRSSHRFGTRRADQGLAADEDARTLRLPEPLGGLDQPGRIGRRRNDIGRWVARYARAPRTTRTPR